MSGYRLRALLEDQEFCNSLVNGGNAQLGLGLNGNKDDSGERLFNVLESDVFLLLCS